MQILGDARIVPDERSNSLIVYANKEDMKMITNIVSKSRCLASSGAHRSGGDRGDSR